MADNLSPLVNLDLINKIYKTINAQITERVYNPKYNPGVALGGESSRYSNAYLQALNVQGDATISGTTTVSGKVISTGGFKGNLIAIGSNDCISFTRYATAEATTATSTTYTLENSLGNSNTSIPTSKAVYDVIGDLETLLANI